MRSATAASPTVVDPVDEVADAVAVDRKAELHLGRDLVALGHRHFAHVVAEAGRTSRPCQSCHAPPPASRRRFALAPPASCQKPDHHLAVQPQAGVMKPGSRSPCAAWFRFMKSMSIVVPRHLAVVLRVQVQERLAQRVQTVDPHLGRRERVHQRISPTQLGSLFALAQTSNTSSDVLTIGR